MRWQKLLQIISGMVVISLLAGLALAAVGGAYKLSYRMKKGQRLKYKTTMNFDQTTEVQGQEISGTVSGTASLHVDVEEIGKEGNITFVYALDSLQTSIKSPQLDTTFRNPEALLGKRTRLTVNALGKKLHSAMVDTLNLSGLLAQAGAGGQTTFRLIELPEKEIKIGESWTTSTADTTAQANSKMVIMPNLTYKVTGEVDTLGYKCLRLAGTGTVKMKGEGMQQGMNFFIEGEGPTNGTAYFAPQEGLLVAAVSNADLEMTIALTGQMSMTIPQSLATKNSTVLVK